MKNDPVFEPMPENPTPSAETPVSEPASLRAEARRNMLVGTLWCVGGLAFSFASYYFAQAGSRYVVATGAILWGAFQAIKGLAAYLGFLLRDGDKAAFRRTIVAAVCALALVGYLTTISLRMVRTPQIDLLDTEQVYTCDTIGLRITIPAGYTALETQTEPETDSTYAYHTMYVLDGNWEFRSEAIEGLLDEETRSVAEIATYCQRRDSAYYDGGIRISAREIETNGIEMLFSEGLRTEYPDHIFTTYDLVSGHTLLTVGISYPRAEYDEEKTRRRIDQLLGGIEIAAPRSAE